MRIILLMCQLIYYHNYRSLKASCYNSAIQTALNREFAEYVTFSDVACRLLRWLSTSPAPDEFFRPTLNYNSHLNASGTLTGIMLCSLRDMG